MFIVARAVAKVSTSQGFGDSAETSARCHGANASLSRVSRRACTQQSVEPPGELGGRVQLAVNGRQQLLPVLHRADVEGVKEVRADRGQVSSTQFGLCKTIYTKQSNDQSKRKDDKGITQIKISVCKFALLKVTQSPPITPQT